MGDQLEKFVKDFREKFDENPEAEALWNRIENDLSENKQFNWTLLWKVAAVLMMICTAVLLIDKYSSRIYEESDELYAEFNQAEAFYTTLIDQKRIEISSYGVEDLTSEFLSDIKELDMMYNELKATFKTKSSDEKLVDAMISNLQLRIEILNQQLMILKKLNETKNETNIDI